MGKLLVEDSLFKRMVRIEENRDRRRSLFFHAYAFNMDDLEAVGRCPQWSLLRIEIDEFHHACVWNQRAVPAARAKGTDRRQCQHAGINQQPNAPRLSR